MYSGHVIDELMEMVARAEDRARGEMTLGEAEAMEYYAPHFLYEGVGQQAVAGVA